jgi:predicted membrane protein
MNMPTDPQGMPGSGGSGLRLTPQLLLGLLVIAAGVILLLDNLGFAPLSRFLNYWPAALVAIGLIKLWQARDGKGGSFSGLLFTIAGIWLLLEELAVVNIDFQDVWPLILVLLGAYIVWQGIAGPQRPRTAVDGHSTVSAVAILGGVARGSNSRAFRGGELTAVMGGLEIDLRQASINGEAVIEIFTMWGGIDIRVPEDWSVESRVVPLLGGIEDKTRPPQGAINHRLTLRGFAIMGGVEIKN